MKKALLMIGLVSLVAGVLLLAFAALSLFGYYNVLDGSAELYHRLHERAILSFAVGIVLAAIGTGSLLFRAKK